MDIADRAWRDIYAMFKRTYGEELFLLMYPDAARTIKGEQVRDHCINNPGRAFVCEEEGKVVGFVTFHMDKKSKIGEISNNAVDPDCRLKGIGQQMYQAVFDRFRQEGMLYAKVGTGLDESHERARKAYERAGFNIKWELVNYFKKL